MPYTDVDIINQGLGKFSSSRIVRINPPKSPLEVHCVGYLQWKESELSKRRWVFATDLEYELPDVGASGDSQRPYKYELPNTVLRPVRVSGAEWKQQGRKILSAYEGLRIPVVLNVLEGEFDPLFVDVLVCRVWLETNDFVKQSKSGKEEAVAAYDDAVREAAKANAFVIGPEGYTMDDDAFPFITGRSGLA